MPIWRSIGASQSRVLLDRPHGLLPLRHQFNGEIRSPVGFVQSHFMPRIGDDRLALGFGKCGPGFK